ncbi:flagellar basal-body rod protein FlgF [Roseivivax isoporae]|uniref:Flagellar basal-body rod protein FlgF n=1 Tax=Roseivivax isoporae LMG 25204 TaxID=1449351 RepID=X7F9W6_9RHOB|nr:flagellar basal-body rod protein FlgF [Roseivivax isoporae]ETX28889.1 flagellar basal-body rod protein FlgF [Roseivivax isoporae LMG 25204]
MESSAYIPISLAAALRRDLDVTANNIANADTAGFKRERVAFESYVHNAAAGPEGDMSYVVDGGSYVDPAQGALKHSGNPLDLAIEGAGWFGYETEDGQRAYGRDGRLTVDAQGNLVTLAGARILDAGGAPVALARELATTVSIAEDGTMTGADGAMLGRIGLFDIPDLQSFERLGNGLFVAPDGAAAAVPAAATRMIQGAVEGSNVQPVVEMTRMIEIQRAYERATKLTQTASDLQRDTIQRLGRPA